MEEAIAIIEMEPVVVSGLAEDRISRTRTRNTLMVTASALIGAGLGAAFMFFTDPRLGHRRRMLVRDKLVHYQHVINNRARIVAQNVKDSSKGKVAEMYGAIRPERYLSDEKLVQRVRSQVGRSLRHPHEFQINSVHGVVTLLAAAPDENYDLLVQKIKDVKGVKGVEFLPVL